MKRLMLSLVAVGALAAAGGALADAECQAGSAWGPKPGCPGSQGVTTLPNVYNDPQYNTSGGPPQVNGILVPNVVVPNGAVMLPGGVLAQALPGILGQQYGYYGYGVPQQYADRDGDGTADHLDRDRDGDGVRNNRDRYPDDPRYR
jgi:hypothetical protein